MNKFEFIKDLYSKAKEFDRKSNESDMRPAFKYLGKSEAYREIANMLEETNFTSHIKMGKGDIAIMLASSNSDNKADTIAFVKRNNEYPLAIDVDCDVTDEEIENGTLGYVTFGHIKSIDALINQLNKLKEKYQIDWEMN